MAIDLSFEPKRPDGTRNIPPKTVPTFGRYLENGTVHDECEQTQGTDVIEPVLMKDTKGELTTSTQRVLLDATKGRLVNMYNACNNSWIIAKIFGKLFLRLPNGTEYKSGKVTAWIGHTESSPVCYFILPVGTLLVHSTGAKETTSLDYMIRLIPGTHVTLESGTPITYGDSNDDISKTERTISLEISYTDFM